MPSSAGLNESSSTTKALGMTDIQEANERYRQFMKKKLTVALAACALVGTLFTGLTLARAQSTNAVTPHASAGAVSPAAAQRHPQIIRAIAALRSAKQDVANAPHDFGGHKKTAIEACDKAIAELEAVLKNDTK